MRGVGKTVKEQAVGAEDGRRPGRRISASGLDDQPVCNGAGRPVSLYDKEQPVIIAMWHGQHFLMPFLRRHYRFKVLISRHSDGEINAIAAERLGVGTVRGSGDHGGDSTSRAECRLHRMDELLAEGWNMALTADVPKVSRVAGLGIIKLAANSGRPIFPVSLATSRRIVLNNWDRSEINLPFSRGAIVVGDPIRVPADADAATLRTGAKRPRKRSQCGHRTCSHPRRSAVMSAIDSRQLEQLEQEA